MSQRNTPKPNNTKSAVKKAARKFKPKTRGRAKNDKRVVTFRSMSKVKNLGGGSKPIEINVQEFENLAASVLDCPVSELATMLGISPRTLKNKLKADQKLREAYKRGKRRARFTLRTIQAGQAARGDSRMGIWLGKQYLKQEEPTSKHEITANLDVAIGWEALDARLAALIAREEKTIDIEEPNTGGEVSTLPVSS